MTDIIMKSTQIKQAISHYQIQGLHDTCH